jgi:hypothetical protein
MSGKEVIMGGYKLISNVSILIISTFLLLSILYNDKRRFPNLYSKMATTISKISIY